MAQLHFGPRLIAICAHFESVYLEHAQIPELRAIVQVRVPLARAPEGTPLPTPVLFGSSKLLERDELGHAGRRAFVPATLVADQRGW